MLFPSHLNKSSKLILDTVFLADIKTKHDTATVTAQYSPLAWLTMSNPLKYLQKYLRKVSLL